MNLSKEERGRRFRKAWIAGVTTCFPITPKPGYIPDWERLPNWQQETDSDIFDAIEAVVLRNEAQV